MPQHAHRAGNCKHIESGQRVVVAGQRRGDRVQGRRIEHREKLKLNRQSLNTMNRRAPPSRAREAGDRAPRTETDTTPGSCLRAFVERMATRRSRWPPSTALVIKYSFTRRSRFALEAQRAHVSRMPSGMNSLAPEPPQWRVLETCDQNRAGRLKGRNESRRPVDRSAAASPADTRSIRQASASCRFAGQVSPPCARSRATVEGRHGVQAEAMRQQVAEHGWSRSVIGLVRRTVQIA